MAWQLDLFHLFAFYFLVPKKDKKWNMEVGNFTIRSVKPYRTKNFL